MIAKEEVVLVVINDTLNWLQEKESSRPPTSKPKNPDEYEFTDENIAKDYRLLWDQYQALQDIMKREKEGQGESAKMNEVQSLVISDAGEYQDLSVVNDVKSEEKQIGKGRRKSRKKL